MSLPSLPIEWIPSDKGLYLPNICTLPTSLFRELKLSAQDWLEIQWSAPNLTDKPTLLCHCSCHSNPIKQFASIIGPSIQTHPDEQIDGALAELRIYKSEQLFKLDILKLKIISLSKDLAKFEQLENRCRTLILLQELEDLFIKDGFIVDTTSFRIKILFTSPATGGLITPWTKIELEEEQVSSTQSLFPSNSPTPPPGLESIFTPFFKWISVAVTKCTPKAILLHGPSGVGKTFAVREMVKYCQVSILEISPSDLHVDSFEETEAFITQFFRNGLRLAHQMLPVVFFMKDIDVLAETNRLLLLLFSHLDRLLSTHLPLVFVATTHQFQHLPISFLRSGRFDHQLSLNPPDMKQRSALLDFFLKKRLMNYQPCPSTLLSLAESTSGYVASDLQSLVNAYPLDYMDVPTFKHILKQVKPSITKHFFLNLDRSLTWDSVAGLDSVKEQLQRYVLWPQKYQAQFRKLGLQPPRGILLYGPPGCSKTTLAKILAVQSGYHFFALSAATILDSHVGESERKLRACFALAQQVAPSIVFLDEVDVLGQRQSSAETNVMSTLLNLMDGMEHIQEVLVLGATNYPDRLDPALIRVGRFDRLMYIGPPDLQGRKAIFQYYLAKSGYASGLPVDELAKMTEFATGAEIENICRQACMLALREGVSELTVKHLQKAVTEWKPFLTLEMLSYYHAVQLRFSPT